MNILGLNFGHDGAACIIRDGKIAAFVLRERHCRVKHAIGVTSLELNLALAEADLAARDIDYCAISSTQNIELLTGLIDGFSISFAPHKGHTAPAPLAELFRSSNTDPATRLSSTLGQILRTRQPPLQYASYRHACPEHEQVMRGEIASHGWLDEYVAIPRWYEGTTLEELSRCNVSQVRDSEVNQFGFSYPVTVTLDGRSIPGYFVNHHVAHAASCFFQSDFEEAAIITHDGFGNGAGYQSGLILHGRGNEVVVLSPHHLGIGTLYDHTALLLGLHAGGAAGMQGKLMGLAPYGKPCFFHHGYIGNWHDGTRLFGKDPAVAWLAHCRQMSSAMGYDLSALGDKKRMTERVNTDIAASTQKLFEECFLYAVTMTRSLLLNSGITTTNLCLSGGTALNCPSNSRLFREAPFDRMFVEPSCSDDGLAIGAALYLHHHLLGHPRGHNFARYPSPYLGVLHHAETVQSALTKYSERISVSTPTEPARAAAEDLQGDKIIAWFEGRSEVGPRALGHRSILANPTVRENWDRVNRLKDREAWRPFAPAVVESEAGRWFEGIPEHSPYMLFTARVKGEGLPAITHVDGSARVQTVSSEAGHFYELLREFNRLSGLPVLLNTSFNGPGEPIVESPSEALEFLITSNLDVLYLDGSRVTRSQG